MRSGTRARKLLVADVCLVLLCGFANQRCEITVELLHQVSLVPGPHVYCIVLCNLPTIDFCKTLIVLGAVHTVSALVFTNASTLILKGPDAQLHKYLPVDV